MDDLSGIRRAPPAGYPPGGKHPLQVEPDSVTVSIRIDREGSALFSDVGLTVLRPSQHPVVREPGQGQAHDSGPADDVKNLTLQDLSATMKSRDTMARGRFRLPCEISLPPGIALRKCEPALFDVEVK